MKDSEEDIFRKSFSLQLSEDMTDEDDRVTSSLSDVDGEVLLNSLEPHASAAVNGYLRRIDRRGENAVNQALTERMDNSM